MNCFGCGITTVRRKLCIKCYHKNWRDNNRERVNKQSREWQKNNPEKCRISRRKYYDKNREKLIKKGNDWKKNNPEKARDIKARTRKKYPGRHTAREYARQYQRGNECEKCNSTENLHFHHTDYIKREGITVCKNCHWKIHNEQKIFVK